MSNFIPMVSSSPPPLDDGPTFDDWQENGEQEDEEYGGFASAKAGTGNSSHTFETATATNIQPPSEKNVNIPPSDALNNGDNWNAFGPSEVKMGGEEDFEAFAAFGDADPPPFSSQVTKDDSTYRNTCKEQLKQSCDSSSKTNTLGHSVMDSPEEEDDCAKPEESKPSSSKMDSQDSTSQGSMTDSGMCSDISPVPRSDESVFAETRSNDTDFAEAEEHREAAEGERTPVQSEVSRISPVLSDCRQLEHAKAEEEEEEEFEAFSSTFPPVSNPNDLAYTDVPDSDNEESDGQTCTGKCDVEPEPLDFKPSSYTEEEVDNSQDVYSDEAFGQFHSPPSLAFEPKAQEDDSQSDKQDSQESESYDSNEVSSKEESGETLQQEPKVQTESSEVPKLTFRSPAVNDDNTDSDDFDDFQDCAVTLEDNTKDDYQLVEGNVDEDDDDDFGEFEDIHQSTQPSEDTEQSGDAWAAFGSADKHEAEDESGDWAAFGKPVASVPKEVDGESVDDNFGDFGDAQVTLEQGDDDFEDFDDPTPTVKTVPPSVPQALSSCFPFGTDGNGNFTDATPTLLLESASEAVIRQEEVPPKHLIPASRFPREQKNYVSIDVCVWNNLKDMEHTSALKYLWNNSINNQVLLRSINIDTRNILMGHKKPSNPIFAPNLTLLEPSRGPSVVSSESSSSKEATPEPASTQPSSSTPQQDIPPAEFDWSSSGLTNPLDVLEKEKELLEALEQPNNSRKLQMLPPLANVLAGMKFTSTTPSTESKEDTELGGDAQDVVDCFPILSFMQATVLMFPVKAAASSESLDG